MRLRTLLLGCGILSALLYIIADVLASVRYEGYSYVDQTISELNAFGAPTRLLTIVFGLAVYVLLIVFGLGVRRAGAGDRRLRVVGGVLVGLGALSLWAVPFASMQVRGVEQPPTHVIEGAVALLLILTAMVFAATALGRRFRLYSIMTIIVMLAFGAWAGLDGARVAQGLPTPWIGVRERISAYSYQLWFAGLALTLLRQGSMRHGSDVPSG
jgi:hypothetical protein